jgi:hypothetical protein
VSSPTGTCWLGAGEIISTSDITVFDSCAYAASAKISLDQIPERIIPNTINTVKALNFDRYSN